MKGFLAGRRHGLMSAHVILGLTLVPQLARAQVAPSSADSSTLTTLIARALSASPTIAAAQHHVDAARARIGPAGARPDPMLMAGLQNQPLGREAPGAAGGGPDPMTMHMIGISQTIPYPGKLALRTAAAERDADAAVAAVEGARLGIVRDVSTAYYELAYIDQALRITDQTRSVLSGVASLTESRYATGSGLQQDALEARLDLTRLAQAANALREQRRGQLATLNALLNRASDTPIDIASIPERIVRAAIPDTSGHIRFTSEAFGASVADSPLPPLAALQSMAIANNAMLHEHEASIAAQAARVALAEKEAKPDVDISLEYGQRNRLADMVSAVVSVPIPIQRSRKQDDDAAAARAELAALESEHQATVNDVRSRVAKMYADLERERTQLALDVMGVLPQSRASVAATTASYEAGKTDLLRMLDSQSALYANEISYHRTLSDFAESLAELEQVVGAKVIP